MMSTLAYLSVGLSLLIVKEGGWQHEDNYRFMYRLPCL